MATCGIKTALLRCSFCCTAILSLIFLIGVLVLWTWNRSHSGYVRLHEGAHFVALYPAPHALTITTWNDPATAGRNNHAHLNTAGQWPMTAETFAYLINRNGRKWNHLGVQWSVLNHLDHGRTLILPNGMLLALFAVLPLWWVQKWNPSRRRATNLTSTRERVDSALTVSEA